MGTQMQLHCLNRKTPLSADLNHKNAQCETCAYFCSNHALTAWNSIAMNRLTAEQLAAAIEEFEAYFAERGIELIDPS